MNHKPLVISILTVALLLFGLSISALALDPADIDLTFAEDSSDYIRVNSLLPEDAQDAEYQCDVYFLYGWLSVGEDGAFRYELDADNADVAAARESGETLTENVTFRYRNESGTEKRLTISFVIRTDEAHMPADSYLLLNDGTAAVAEGRLFSRDGTRTDGEEPALLGISFAGGEYMLSEDLELTYSLSNRSRVVQRLSAGEQSVQQMKLRLRAEDGSTITKVVSISVCGVNDVPSVKNATHALAIGDKSISASALRGSTQGDGWAAQHTFTWITAASDARYGTVVLNADGSYSYAIDRNNADVNGLTDIADPLQETFYYTYEDKDGSLAEGSVTFTIAYADISPRVVNQTAILTEDAGDDSYFFEGSALTGSTLGNGTAAEHTFQWTNPAESKYGTIQLFTDGSYSFRLDNESDAVQNLYPGANAQETYGYTYTDVDGDQMTGSVVLTIQGANDLPQVRYFIINFTEDSGTSADDYITSGNVLNDAVSGDGELTLSRFTWDIGHTAKYGEMTAGADGSFTYRLDNSSRAVQALKAEERVNDTFFYEYTDANGDICTGCVNFYVTGVKDAPTLENKSASLSLGGTVRAVGNALTNSTMGDGSEEDHIFAWTSAAIMAAENTQYGTMTLEDDGDYTYELDEDNPAVRSLTEDETLTEVFSFTYSNGLDTATASVTITINYSDIHPIAPDIIRTVSEDGTDAENENCLPLTGDILAQCKLGNGVFDMHAFTWVTVGSSAQFGTIILGNDGTYSYMLDTSKSQFLKQGEMVTDSFDYTFKDSDDDTAITGTLIIRIMGVNDAPVWKHIKIEDTFVMISNSGFLGDIPNLTANATDIDGDSIYYVSEIRGSDGYVSTTVSGYLVSITPNMNNAAVKALTGDATLNAICDIYISDGIAKVLCGSITVTIVAPDDVK